MYVSDNRVDSTQKWPHPELKLYWNAFDLKLNHISLMVHNSVFVFLSKQRVVPQLSDATQSACTQLLVSHSDAA